MDGNKNTQIGIYLRKILQAKNSIKEFADSKGVSLDNIPFTDYAKELQKIKTTQQIEFYQCGELKYQQFDGDFLLIVGIGWMDLQWDAQVNGFYVPTSKTQAVSLDGVHKLNIVTDTFRSFGDNLSYTTYGVVIKRVQDDTVVYRSYAINNIDSFDNFSDTLIDVGEDTANGQIAKRLIADCVRIDGCKENEAVNTVYGLLGTWEDAASNAFWMNYNGSITIQDWYDGESYIIGSQPQCVIRVSSGICYYAKNSLTSRTQIQKATFYSYVDSNLYEGEDGSQVKLNVFVPTSSDISFTNPSVMGWSGYKMTWSQGSVGNGFTVSYNSDNSIIPGIVGEYTWNQSLHGYSKQPSISDYDTINIVYDTESTQENLFTGWTMKSQDGERYYTNPTAGENATLEQICEGPWEMDWYGTSTIPIFTPLRNPAGWVKSETLTTGLSIDGYTPQIGKVYAIDTTVSVDGMYPQTITKVDLTDLTPQNIKYGITISGVVGSYTSGATANSSDLLLDKTAFVNGSMISGSISTYGGVTTVNPSNSSQTLQTAGKYIQSNITVQAADILDTSDANASNSDILLNKTAYVNGSKISGSISTYDGITSVNPSNSSQTLSTAGKYLDSDIIVNAASELEFYQCAGYITESSDDKMHAYSIYGRAGESSYPGGVNPGAFGIYYPEDISADAIAMVYMRKDGKYKLSIVDAEDEAEDEVVKARIVITKLDVNNTIVGSSVPIEKTKEIWENWSSFYSNVIYSGENNTIEKYEDGYFPDYSAQKISYDKGDFLTISGAGIPECNGIFGRACASMDYESAGIMDNWVKEDGSAKLLLSSDELWDEENDQELIAMVLCSGAVYRYELPMPDADGETVITGAADLADYTWTVTENGKEPVPIVTDTVIGWSGYKMEKQAVKDIEITSGSVVLPDRAVSQSFIGIYKKIEPNKYYCEFVEKGDGGYDNYTYYSSDMYLIQKNIVEDNEHYGIGNFWFLIPSTYIENVNPEMHAILYAKVANDLGVTDWYEGMQFNTEQYQKNNQPRMSFVDTKKWWWEKSETLTSGLSIYGYTPQIGKVYAVDTMISINGMYPQTIVPDAGATNVTLVFRFGSQTPYSYVPFKYYVGSGDDRQWVGFDGQTNNYTLRYEDGNWVVVDQYEMPAWYVNAGSGTDPWNCNWTDCELRVVDNDKLFGNNNVEN